MAVEAPPLQPAHRSVEADGDEDQRRERAAVGVAQLETGCRLGDAGRVGVASAAFACSAGFGAPVAITGVMPWLSIAAIYFVVWALCLFVVLPFGVRTSEEEGVKPEPGHADSAPHRFSFGRVALRVTVLATLLFGLFYANYVYGWIGIEALDWATPPRHGG